MNIRPQRKFDFSAGIQDATSWILKAQNALVNGVNIVFNRKIGAFRRRDGFTPVGDRFGSGQNFATTDVNIGTNVITVPSSQAINTTDKVIFSTTGTLPAGLSLNTIYYAIHVTDTTIKVATSFDLALANTAVDITSVGSGTHTVTVLREASGGHTARFSTGSVRMVATASADGLSTVVRTQDGLTGVWTDLITGMPVGSQVFFFDYLDETYVTGYSGPGIPIQPYNVDKTLNVSTTRNIFAMPRCHYLVEWNGALYACNVTIDGVRYADRAYESSPPLGAITFIQADQSGLITLFPVDSVRYLKVGMTVGIYEKGTDNLLYTVTITAVDKVNNTFSFVPPTQDFSVGDVYNGDDAILLPDATNFTTGMPVQFTTTGTLPTGISLATTYYVIKPATLSSNSIRSGATFADDASTGNDPWTNPGNAATSDNVYATFTGATGFQSHYLKATNFGFAVPAGATIVGIKAEFEVKGTTGGSTESNTAGVKLVKGGTIGGSDLNDGAVFPTSDTYLPYGGASSLWGLTWTPTDINASNFGVVFKVASIAGTASLDHIRITVYYTEVNSNAIKVATSQANAIAGTPVVDITGSGSGTHTIHPFYEIGDNDEVWLSGRKGKLSMLWNTDYPTPEQSEFLLMPSGNGSSTAITAVIKSNNRLFLFTRSSRAKFDGQNLISTGGIGCIAHRTLQNLEDDWMIWLDANGNIYARNDASGQQEKISKAIREPVMRNVTQDNLAAANAGVIDSVYKLYVGDIDDENVRVAYDFDTNTWAIEKLAYPCLIQITDESTGYIKPYFFSDNGRLYIDETGNLDDDKVIPMEAELGRDMIGTEQHKEFVGATVFSENATGLKLMAAIGRGQFHTVGQITEDEEYISFPEKGEHKLEIGISVNFKVVGSVEGDAPEIQGIVPHWTPREDVPNAGRKQK